VISLSASSNPSVVVDDVSVTYKTTFERRPTLRGMVRSFGRGEKIVRDDTGGAGPADRRRRASVPTSSGQGAGPSPGANPEPQPGV